MLTDSIGQIVAAFILSCSNIATGVSATPSLIKAKTDCIQRVSDCSKKMMSSSTLGDSVLDCSKEVY
jgi:hypothetical protein